MRVAAAILGIVGGLMGIAFAQLVMYAAAIFGALAAAFGSGGAGQPLAWSIAALTAYSIGVAGGAVALTRPRVAALVLLVAGLGGLGATIASGATAANVLSPGASPTPAATVTPARTFSPATRQTQAPTQSPATAAPLETYLIAAAPFSGPTLLLLAAFCAVLARRSGDVTPQAGGRSP